MSVEFEDNRLQVKEALKDASIAFLHEAAGEIQSRTRRNSRVATDQTKGSYEYKVDESDLKATIGSNLENSIWEEFGTGEYALNGDGRKGGWVYKDAKGDFHRTKGKTPNRPLHNAFTALKNKIIRIAEEKFKGVG